jgi:hypothetical protein
VRIICLCNSCLDFIMQATVINAITFNMAIPVGV